MSISLNNSSLNIFTQRYGKGLKSTEERVERAQKTQSQIAFFEGKKADLKNMHCTTLDEIANKLELFNNYNDMIASIKEQFNQEQVMHCMDEAKEFGEKVAKAVEKLEPKTAEERREEMAKEALGIEGEGGILDEMLEEVEDIPEEALQEMLDESLADKDALNEELEEKLPEIIEQEKLTKMYLEKQYVPIDVKA